MKKDDKCFFSSEIPDGFVARCLARSYRHNVVLLSIVKSKNCSFFKNLVWQSKAGLVCFL